MYHPNQDQFPFNAVVYIEVDWDDGSSTRGSGAIVGRNDVVTAAHVVSKTGKKAVDVDIYPAFDGAEGPWGSFNSGQWRTDYYLLDYSAGGTLTQREAAHDVALIGLSAALGDKTGWLGMRPNAPSGEYSVVGYPSQQGVRLTADAGYAGSANGTFDISSIYHAPGSSGGPLLNRGNEVVGVVSTSVHGARLDEEWDDLVRWMANNDYLLPREAQQPAPAFILQVARLYEAGLNRKFDAPGLNHWIDAREAGVPLETIAAHVLDSPEFTRNHGDDDGMTNPQFVRTMYGNVLGRDPEQSGFNFWVAGMNAGASRESVLVSISDSPENVAQSAYLQALRQTAAGGYWDV